MTGKRIVVLRGGPSSERDVSLKTGEKIIRELKDDHHIYDVEVSLTEEWLVEGKRIDPHDLLRQVDVVVNALHGSYGEDGKVQRMLETSKVPFTGSSAFSSALSMNKVWSKKILEGAGIKTPVSRSVRFDEYDKKVAKDIFNTFPHPAVVKPSIGGSSIGVTIARNLEELENGLAFAFEHSDVALIEELIQGKEATCGVIKSFRGEDYYVLPPVEIIPPQNSGFFDFDSKYGGETQEICPARFGDDIKREIRETALKSHKALELGHYSRTDMIITPKRGIYVLEVNSLPGLSEESLLPKSLEAVGSNLKEFLNHIVELAHAKGK